MLNEISAGRISEIADRAQEMRATEGNMVRRVRVGRDETGGETVPGSRTDDALDNPQSLAAAGDGAQQALERDVDALTPEQRRELLAVMFIGRGEFAPKEWNAALTQAQSIPDAALTRSATDEIQLHDYLKKGLYELGIAS